MNAEPAVLASEIRLALAALAKLEDSIVSFRGQAFSNRGTVEAMASAQFLSNYYTCVETILFRISQHFENSLQKDRWHSALLDAMRMEIPGIRPQVLSDSCHRDLDELRRFRHFTRYYYDIDYDWRRLAFLFDVFESVRTPIRQDLHNFAQLLLDPSSDNPEQA